MAVCGWGGYDFASFLMGEKGDFMIQQQLEQALQQAFKPAHLLLENESHMHGGGSSSANKIRESHFKAVIVSDAFVAKRLVQQHQLVYSALGELMGQIHALALHTYTPEQWEAVGSAPLSPPCPKS